jgi:tRNA nucleotidyltransferase/poly(A) polymerase
MEKRIKFDIQVPTDIQHIQQIFKKNGYILYLVGGSVRDALLNNKIKDYDLVTDAVPDKVEEIMNNSGFKTLATGKAFGVINVFTDKYEYEIATFRGECYSDKDKRRPETVYFSDIETDSARRDLTCNALYYDIETKEIIDLVDGYSDIKNGIIKTVGKAEDRFNEDKLRILRIIRFAARFGSNIDNETDLALIKDLKLEGISGERIRDEFIKGLVSAKSSKNYLELVDRYNLFDWIFKDLIIDKRFIDNDDPIVLISMLLHKNGSSVLSKKLNELKYSIDEIRKITTLISMLDLDIETAPRLKRLFIKSGLCSDKLRNFGVNMWISTQLLDSFEEYLKLPNITGQEAMDKYKIEKPGAELGKAINIMEIDVFNSFI